MKIFGLGIWVIFMAISVSAKGAKIILAIHGGAGVRSKKQMTPDWEKKYRAALTAALSAGGKVLNAGGSSLDGVEAAVRSMEEAKVFNAGNGAVFNAEGKNELDAAIMDGQNERAGAVGAVTTVKHPISAARAVMEKSKHVLLVGPGADKFAKTNGLEMVDPSYFRTEERWQEYQTELKKEKTERRVQKAPRVRFGTVGAVALDSKGNLAAATSTGGVTLKRMGRLGDSPLIGSGTYAKNQTCAVSGTGDGEYFIRAVAAYSLSAQMEFAHRSVKQAANNVIRKVGKLGGEGGLIALDKKGKLAMPFNSEGMYRGYLTAAGKIEVFIY